MGRGNGGGRLFLPALQMGRRTEDGFHHAANRLVVIGIIRHDANDEKHNSEQSASQKQYKDSCPDIQP
ncbi:hypothetical protein D3P09_11615 [Paenibacillus pinisoli]|uniref:Uncharacterized protein n=1 Tax=Paenibacillus pinisoli TaxID=1276110 RepID=A0A3A6PGH4_9BACL|nr:hypothetical protein D3P09_11615 [Paenibacillus pinisoli]